MVAPPEVVCRLRPSLPWLRRMVSRMPDSCSRWVSLSGASSAASASCRAVAEWAELQRAQEAIFAQLQGRSEVATMTVHADEETGQVKVTLQPKKRPDDAQAFKRDLRLPQPDNPRVTVEVTLSDRPVGGRTPQ
ncbi:hypothetical protein ABZW11_07360 [Nonomuraea sp. NPDC004580]|uniref:hypothetical protein n=1 Tax=Nonomuraea sp. NPDC004580 TaxID=3154552 RepID=UPI0033B2E2AB